MIPFYSRDENWEKMYERMKVWEGTPYRHLGLQVGRGVDCTLLAGAIFVETGVLTDLKYDYYPRDWHLNTQEELVLNSILRHYRECSAPGIFIQHLPPMDEEEMIRGDLMAFNYPQKGIMISHHAALWVDDYDGAPNFMFNAIEGTRGCCFTQFGSYWRRRLTNVFRVMEE